MKGGESMLSAFLLTIFAGVPLLALSIYLIVQNIRALHKFLSSL